MVGHQASDLFSGVTLVINSCNQVQSIIGGGDYKLLNIQFADPMTSSIYCGAEETLDAKVQLNLSQSSQQNESASDQSCLLDVMSVRLTEMDLYSAKWMTYAEGDQASSPVDERDIGLQNYIVKMDENQPLKER